MASSWFSNFWYIFISEVNYSYIKIYSNIGNILKNKLLHKKYKNNLLGKICRLEPLVFSDN